MGDQARTDERAAPPTLVRRTPRHESPSPATDDRPAVRGAAIGEGPRLGPRRARTDWRAAAMALPGARALPASRRFLPQACGEQDTPPAGKEWLHEILWIGERLRVQVEAGQARLRSSDGRDRSARFPEIVRAVEGLGLDQAWLDGIVVALDRHGRSDAAALERALRSGDTSSLRWLGFDLPALAGVDLAAAPLLARKRLLETVLAGATSKVLAYSRHVVGHGDRVFATSLRQGVAGIVSKRADAPYVPGRGSAWVEIGHDRRARDPSPAGDQDKAGGARMAVRITHPERVVFPAAGDHAALTKGEVADYYRGVARWMLPELVRRPLSLVRCPDGSEGACFFQKHHSDSFGPAVKAVPLAQKDGVHDYLYVEDVEGVLALVQFNALEFHPWGARVESPECPDRLVFDLDPDEGLDWKAVVAAAREVRARLRERGLESFVRLSGGKGLHVVAPIAAGPSWEQAKAFCESVADAMADAHPARYVATMGKARREGRIFIDWLRNARGSTSAASWTLRSRPGAPVAMPLRWEELGKVAGPAAFDPARALRRAASLRADPWDGIAALEQSLPK